MFKKITEKFKGDRKYFSIVFFVLIILGISGIITESVINRTQENWDNILIDKISRISKNSLFENDNKNSLFY